MQEAKREDEALRRHGDGSGDFDGWDRLHTSLSLFLLFSIGSPLFGRTCITGAAHFWLLELTEYIASV